MASVEEIYRKGVTAESLSLLKPVFSKDGTKMFVAVGSADNVSDTRPVQEHRANILEYTPDGKFVGVYASGIRNPVGLGVNPETGCGLTTHRAVDLELGAQLDTATIGLQGRTAA